MNVRLKEAQNLSSRQERLQFVSSNAVKDQYERRKATRFYGQQKAGDFRFAEVIISLCIRKTLSHKISVSNWNQSFPITAKSRKFVRRVLSQRAIS